MRSAFRVQSRRLPPAQRRVYRAATLYFLAVAAAMVWPIYPLFSRVRPLLLGMPLSLFYLAALLVVSFGVVLALYLWEERRGLVDEREDRDSS